jgi:hypothetical protein
MTARIKRGFAGAIALLAATAATAVGPTNEGWAAGSGQRAFGISSDGTLMATFTTVRVVTGLSGDTALIGIDFRVQDGLMYGVGNYGGIYTITTPPATPDVVVKKVSQLSVALYGTRFGVDFNPAADRLRVISDNGQNLRHNLADGKTVVDPALTTPPAAEPAKGATAAAYTNNDLDPSTATTLFDINTVTDQVVIQSPANLGFLAPTGSLGVNADSNAGLDIFSDLTNGKATSQSAFATLTRPGGPTTFYNVDLLTGAASSVGQFPLPITDVAVALDTN